MFSGCVNSLYNIQRALLRLHVGPADIFADNADAYQLNAREKEEKQKKTCPAWNGRSNHPHEKGVGANQRGEANRNYGKKKS